jgi:hypothetical protein
LARIGKKLEAVFEDSSHHVVWCDTRIDWLCGPCPHERTGSQIDTGAVIPIGREHQ